MRQKAADRPAGLNFAESSNMPPPALRMLESSLEFTIDRAAVVTPLLEARR
jgi:hypothetical protein